MLSPVKLYLIFKTWFHFLLIQEASLYPLPVRGYVLFHSCFRGALCYCTPHVPPSGFPRKNIISCPPSCLPSGLQSPWGESHAHSSCRRGHWSLYLALDWIFNWIEKLPLSTFILLVAGLVEKERHLELLMTSGFLDCPCRNRCKVGSVHCKLMAGREGDSLRKKTTWLLLEQWSGNISKGLRWRRSDL